MKPIKYQLTPARIAELKKQEAERRLRQLQKRWAYLKTGIYWAAGMNRYHESTHTAHIVFRGGALCGAHPHALSGSFPTAAEAGCRECKNCRGMIERIKHHVGSP